METIECIHKEHMKSGENHTEIGVCQYCEQTVVYDRVNLKAKPIITKLGRKDGKIVLPKPGFDTQLSGKDQADLTLARLQPANSKHPLAEKEPAGEIPPRPGKDDPQGRHEWFREHKKRLVDALLKMGAEAFQERYNLPRQIVSHLKADKQYKKLAKKSPPAPAAGEKASKARTPRPKAPRVDGLPQLPAWSDDWGPEVQTRWLDIYARLIN